MREPPIEEAVRLWHAVVEERARQLAHLSGRREPNETDRISAAIATGPITAGYHIPTPDPRRTR